MMGRSARALSLLLFGLGLGMTMPATARGADCGDALLPVEQVICSTPGLHASDARMARRYAVLRGSMDAEATDALRDDQRWFLKARDRAVEGLRGKDLVAELADRYVARVAFLEAVRARPTPGIVGVWGNVAGRLTVSRSDGRYILAGSGANPARQEWSCEIAAEGHGDGTSQASFLVPPAPGLDRWIIDAARKGAMLWVAERPVDRNAGVRPYCGGHGMIGGAYFWMEADGK